MKVFPFVLFLVVGAVAGCYLGYHYELKESDIPITSCLPDDLKASVEFQGAAGNIFGDFQITNESKKNCRISGNSFVQANYNPAGNGNFGVVNNGLPSIESYVLKPGQSVYAVYHAPNGPQCNTGIRNVPVAFSYMISADNKVLFSDNRGNLNFSVAACRAPSDMTQVSISNLSDQKTGQ